MGDTSFVEITDCTGDLTHIQDCAFGREIYFNEMRVVRHEDPTDQHASIEQ